MPKFAIVAKGDQFGYLIATGNFKSEKKRRFVECSCICGVTKFFLLNSLRKGTSKSCGCRRSEFYQKTNIANGFSRTGHDVSNPLYTIWQGMRDRCYNPKCVAFHNYGGRGILVCIDWRNDFKSFYDWAIKNGWVKGLTIDRYPDKNGNYAPDNCRFCTMKQQQRNKRNNRIIEIYGERKCISEWADDIRCRVGYYTFNNRVRANWNLIDALTRPSRTKKDGRKQVSAK